MGDQFNTIFGNFDIFAKRGTGFSLKRLVQLYGGEIGVESKVNEGTAFSVTLPEANND